MTEGVGSPDAREARSAERLALARLAMTGLVTTLSLPALLHALRGNLHNVALLNRLLQREAAGPQDAATLRASAQNRTTSIGAEVAAMQHRMRMLESLSGATDSGEAAVCDLSTALDEVLQLARVEAARRGVALSANIPPRPVPILCALQACQQLMLTCTLYAIRRCDQGATIIVSAIREDDVASVAFSTHASATDEGDAEDAMLLDLIAELARVAGVRFCAQPAIGIAFVALAH